MLFQVLTILLFSFPLINAATLGGTCADHHECSGVGLICKNNECQCDMPWYRPCRSGCEAVPSVSYAGETCKIQQNCISYAACMNQTKCICMPQFEEKNGACFKPLDTSCANDNECWSNYCAKPESKCQCPPGTSATDSLTCEKKLVNTYENWATANEKSEFCFHSDSCLDTSAICKADPAHPGNKFCQCLLDSKIENGKCERIKSQLLSPLDEIPTDYGKCGECEDTNAVCIQAATKKTCWCRSGYGKKDKKCQKYHDKQTLIFPNQGDVQAHNFTKDCPWESSGGLCVCPSGYKFDEAMKSCEKYHAAWDGIYEYGVCTQINSNDQAIQQHKLCPEPLKCIEKGDKHVCSCGPDQFLNLANTSQCVYYIGKGASDANGACPQHTLPKAAGQNCECQSGYKATDNDRQCELQLSEASDLAGCDSALVANTACELFGKGTFLCKIGECRCKIGESAPNSERTSCLAKLNTQLSSPHPDCPQNSKFDGSRCICNRGYETANNLLTCVKKDLALVAHEGGSSTQSALHTTEDCTPLFTGPVEFYTDNKCRCRHDAVLNDDNTGCKFKLNVVLSDPKSESDCPPNGIIQANKCECSISYRDNNNNRCIPIQEFVYDEGDNRAEHVTDFIPGACVVLFGSASDKSSKGNYCICKETVAFPRADNKFCHFYVNTSTSDLKSYETCPENSEPTSETPQNRCVCKAGYEVTPDNKLCTKIVSIRLEGFGVNPGSNDTSCVQRSTAECENLYGAHAFCLNDRCYCDRRYHYLTADGKCGKLSGVFPGEQELDIYSCRTTADCPDKKFVVCDSFHGSTSFKVCQCEKGVFWNPDTNQCDNDRCTNCNEGLGFECRNHECQCKPGTYFKDDRCVKNIELKLHEVCNSTNNYQLAEDSSTICDGKCNRAICQSKYKIKDSTCVLSELSSDKCLHKPDICSQIDRNAVCDKDKNRCLCKGGFYQSENQCETPVDFPCLNDNDCDNKMQCKGGRCACQEGQDTKDVSDAFGRSLQRCVDSHTNNAKQDSRNLMLIFLASFLSFYFFF